MLIESEKEEGKPDQPTVAQSQEVHIVNNTFMNSKPINMKKGQRMRGSADEPEMKSKNTNNTLSVPWNHNQIHYRNDSTGTRRINSGNSDLGNED